MATAGPVPVQDLPSHERYEPGSVRIPIAVYPSTASQDVSPSEADAAVSKVVESFNTALAAKDYNAVGQLFLKDGYWRDHLALSWELRTLKGTDKIISKLQESCPLKHVEVDRSNAFISPTPAPLDGKGAIKGVQSFVIIETEFGSGRGIIRLAQENGQWKIWTLYTLLTDLKGYEEPKGVKRPNGVQHGANPGRKNWLDRREEETAFANSDPDVLIVGKLYSSSFPVLLSSSLLGSYLFFFFATLFPSC